MKVAFLGDSIPAGTWLIHPKRDCIITRLEQKLGCEIHDYTVGGKALHSYDPTAEVIMNQVTRLIESCEEYTTAIIWAGTNDLVTHYTMSETSWAAIWVDLALQPHVPNRIWPTLLPLGKGTSHPDWWLPNLSARWVEFTSWQKAQWGPTKQLMDYSGLWQENAGIINPAYDHMLLDGLHPSRYGALDIVDQFDLDLIK